MIDAERFSMGYMENVTSNDEREARVDRPRILSVARVRTSS